MTINVRTIELAKIAAESAGAATPEEMVKAADNGMMKAFVYHTIVKSFLFFKKKTAMLRLIDKDGVIRLQNIQKAPRTWNTGNRREGRHYHPAWDRRKYKRRTSGIWRISCAQRLYSALSGLH